MRWLHWTFPVVVLLAAAAIAVCGQREPLQPEGRRPRIWEYKVLETAPHDVGGIEKRLQSAGADGWECVGLSFPSFNGSSAKGVLVLKRQK
jgi:hypothetical protein